YSKDMGVFGKGLREVNQIVAAHLIGLPVKCATDSKYAVTSAGNTSWAKRVTGRGRRSWLGFPVVDQRNWRGHAFVHSEIDQESLAIRRHGVLLLIKGGPGNTNRKQGHWCSGFQRLPIGLHRGCHHLAVQRHVKDFLASLVPAGLDAAVTGDLELPARSRKRLDVDLEPAGFVRLIGDPLAVR